MSHYTTLPTQIVDAHALIMALADLGFPANKVETHAEPQQLYGYRGDERPERAHVIIRRKHVGFSSNDIGFVRGEDGAFHAIISEFDQLALGYDDAWLQRLTQRYAYHVTLAELAQQGFTLAEETDRAGTIHLRLRRA